LGLSRPKAVGSLFVESRNERRNRREVGMSRLNHRNLRSKQSNHRRKAQLWRG